MRSLRILVTSLFGLLAAITLAGVTLAAAPAALASSAELSWLWPVEGEHSIRLDYQAPATEYGRGHRGIDLPVDVGQDVRAPASGIVTYVGNLAGRGVLSIHVGEYLLSFEPLEASVAEGDVVTRGQMLGKVGSGSHCDACLHVGVRRNGLYLSPMKLLESLPKAKLEAWSDEHWASLPAE